MNDLPNTPILWTSSLTNYRILSQEICFRGSQYYKYSLLVSGRRHTVSLTSHTNFARLFQTLWSPWRLCWLMDNMPNGWPPYFNINPVPSIFYWWIWMPLQRVKIAIGTHIRSGSTMINTPWHAKIDGQESIYFMVLPVGGTLIDLGVSMNFTQMPMELWQPRWILSQEPWENPSCGGGVPLVTTWNYTSLLRREVIMKTKTRWALLTLVSSRSLD